MIEPCHECGAKDWNPYRLTCRSCGAPARHLMLVDIDRIAQRVADILEERAEARRVAAAKERGWRPSEQE